MSDFIFEGKEGTFNVFFEKNAPNRLELAANAQQKESMTVNNFPESIISKLYKDFDLVKPNGVECEDYFVYESDVCLMLTREEMKERGFCKIDNLLETLNSAQFSQIYGYMALQPNAEELIKTHQSNIKKGLEKQKLLLDCDTPTQEKPYLLRLTINENDYLAKTFESESELSEVLNNAYGKGVNEIQKLGFAYLSNKISNSGQ